MYVLSILRHLHTADVTDGLHVALWFLGKRRSPEFLVVPVHCVQLLSGSLYLCLVLADIQSSGDVARAILCETNTKHVRCVDVSEACDLSAPLQDNPSVIANRQRRVSS